MSQKLLASMPPGMIRTLQNIDRYPDGFYHGPMLKGLIVRGLVTIHQDTAYITWKGQQVLNQLGGADKTHRPCSKEG